MNIYFPLFTGTNQIKANKNNKEQLQTYLPKVCNFKLPYYDCDNVSFSGNEVKLCNSAISGKIKFLSSIFEFDQKEIEKLSDFDSLLKFMSIKNLNGHSIKSVLTASLNSIENKKTTEETITNLTEDEISNFCKAVKLVFGLDENKAHSYNEIMDIINSEGKIKFYNKQYIQKILINKKFINLVIENIPDEKSKDLFGVKSIHTVKKIDRSQNSAKVISSKIDFFSSIFKLDERTRKSIKNADNLLKFINTEKSSGYSIKSVLIESLNNIDAQNTSDKRLSNFTKVIRFFINSKKMPTTETIRDEFGFTTTKYVQELFKDSNFINKIIENIPPEKAENLIGVNGLHPITEIDPVKITKQVIDSRIKFLENFFVLDPEIKQNTTDYKKYLSLIIEKNSSGHSIDSVLTESVNNIILQNITDEKLSNRLKGIKLATGIGGENLSTYSEIMDANLGFENVQYVDKTLKNQKLINMIKTEIHKLDNIENLVGIKAIQPTPEITTPKTKKLSRKTNIDIAGRKVKKQLNKSQINLKVHNTNVVDSKPNQKTEQAKDLAELLKIQEKLYQVNNVITGRKVKKPLIKTQLNLKFDNTNAVDSKPNQKMKQAKDLAELLKMQEKLYQVSNVITGRKVKKPLIKTQLNLKFDNINVAELKANKDVKPDIFLTDPLIEQKMLPQDNSAIGKIATSNTEKKVKKTSVKKSNKTQTNPEINNKKPTKPKVNQKTRQKKVLTELPKERIDLPINKTTLTEKKSKIPSGEIKQETDIENNNIPVKLKAVPPTMSRSHMLKLLKEKLIK